MLLMFDFGCSVTRNCKITSIVPYGAFVEIVPGREVKLIPFINHTLMVVGRHVMLNLYNLLQILHLILMHSQFLNVEINVISISGTLSY